MMNKDDKNALALEYVLGTLRGEERDEFAKQLACDDSLMQAVRYWENSLMPEPQSVPELAPKTATFQNIQAAINQGRSVPNEQTKNKPKSLWERLLPWKVMTSAAFAMLLMVSVVLVNHTFHQGASPNTDYVAVLVDDSDAPVLTALAASDGSTLWLKWENWQASEDHSLQLWAKSRRDGQIRPLLVFGNSELKEVKLDEASLRLIQDSSHLIITREEVGGSPLDEPSDMVIAKGVCIRLAETRDRA
jgi:anti-sigma-K factor RskA